MTFLPKSFKERIRRKAMRPLGIPPAHGGTTLERPFVTTLFVMKTLVAEHEKDPCYIIWRRGGGFFSILSSVLAHLQIAEALRATPVVDLKHFRTFYSEETPIQGSQNVWDYYFDPVSALSLEDAYSATNGFLGSGAHPMGEAIGGFGSKSTSAIYDRWVRLNEYSKAHLEEAARGLQVGATTLGVHYRGQEMRTAVSHPFPPTLGQMFVRIDRAMETGLFDQIYVVTERVEYLTAFQRRYGRDLVFSDAYRGDGENAYAIYPRKSHRYLLGLEILTDALLLARCGALICGQSNVSDFAISRNQGRYLWVDIIDNGRNSARKIPAKFLWRAKAMLPVQLGGFGEASEEVLDLP